MIDWIYLRTGHFNEFLLDDLDLHDGITIGDVDYCRVMIECSLNEIEALDSFLEGSLTDNTIDAVTLDHPDSNIDSKTFIYTFKTNDLLDIMSGLIGNEGLLNNPLSDKPIYIDVDIDVETISRMTPDEYMVAAPLKISKIHDKLEETIRKEVSGKVFASLADYNYDIKRNEVKVRLTITNCTLKLSNYIKKSITDEDFIEVVREKNSKDVKFIFNQGIMNPSFKRIFDSILNFYLNDKK